MGQSQHLFSSKDLSSHLEQIRWRILESIKNETDDYIRNVNEEAYIASLESRSVIEELQLFTDQSLAQRCQTPSKLCKDILVPRAEF